MFPPFLRPLFPDLSPNDPPLSPEALLSQILHILHNPSDGNPSASANIDSVRITLLAWHFALHYYGLNRVSAHWAAMRLIPSLLGLMQDTPIIISNATQIREGKNSAWELVREWEKSPRVQEWLRGVK